MGFGIGTSADVGWGEADSWGGPDNGVDLVGQTGVVKAQASYRMSEDAYLALIIVGSLAALWLMGAVTFKSVRL